MNSNTDKANFDSNTPPDQFYYDIKGKGVKLFHNF